MQTNSHHLNSEHLTIVNGLAAEIVKAVHPEKVILYACSTVTQRHWHVATGSHQLQDQLGCHLLVIPAVTDQRTDDMLRSLLHEIAIQDVTTHYTVSKRSCVNEALGNSSRFFTTICMRGMMLYDNGHPFAVPQQSYTAKEHLIAAEQEWGYIYPRVVSFYNGAYYYQQAGDLEQAVFCLHQCVEQLTMALLKALIGYRPSTHQLDKLLSQLRLAGLHTVAAFPCNTPDEVALFQTLKMAYTASRYSNDFRVTPETAAVLMERVGKLLVGGRSLYEGQVRWWQEEAAGEGSRPLTVSFMQTLNPAS